MGDPEQTDGELSQSAEVAVELTGDSSGVPNGWRRWGAGLLSGGRLGVRRGLDLLYPPSCPDCGVLMGEDCLAESASESGLCVDCLASYPPPVAVGCDRCGVAMGQVGRGEKQACRTCRRRRLQFVEAVSLGRYDGALRQAVLRMKGAASDRLAVAMGRLLAERQAEQIRAWQPDLVLPVPMHWTRRLRRGTNPAESLARALAGFWRISCSSRILRLRRKVIQQHMLGAEERFRNVRAAYRVTRSYAITGATVLLVDDILTTGATTSEAARALLAAGAEQVYVAVVAQASDLN